MLHFTVSSILKAGGSTVAGMSATGQKIKELREAQRLSLAQLGESAGISASAVSQIENGLTKEPKPSHLLAFARRLGTSMEALTDPDMAARDLRSYVERLGDAERKELLGHLLTALGAIPVAERRPEHGGGKKSPQAEAKVQHPAPTAKAAAQSQR